MLVFVRFQVNSRLFTFIFQAGQQLVDFGMSPSGKRASTLIVTNDKEMSVQVCAALLHQFILKSKSALE